MLALLNNLKEMGPLPSKPSLSNSKVVNGKKDWGTYFFENDGDFYTYTKGKPYGIRKPLGFNAIVNYIVIQLKKKSKRLTAKCNTIVDRVNIAKIVLHILFNQCP